jgi:hypothetical protein
VQTSTAPRYPEALQARETLAALINRQRRVASVRGDHLVALHDAAAGKAVADSAKAGLAEEIASSFEGDVIQFCETVKARIPSAKPCRTGMRNKHVRQQLRAGDIQGWGWDRLCAVAASLGHDVVVTLQPRQSA